MSATESLMTQNIDMVDDHIRSNAGLIAHTPRDRQQSPTGRGTFMVHNPLLAQYPSTLSNTSAHNPRLPLPRTCLPALRSPGTRPPRQTHFISNSNSNRRGNPFIATSKTNNLTTSIAKYHSLLNQSHRSVSSNYSVSHSQVTLQHIHER